MATRTLLGRLGGPALGAWRRHAARTPTMAAQVYVCIYIYIHKLLADDDEPVKGQHDTCGSYIK